MVVAEQHDSQSDNYSNVLETSRLRPEVEPFVPKAQNGQAAFYMMAGNGGFSLDAPEFIPNVYNGEVYTWMPNQYIMTPTSNHPRFSIPRFRDKYMRQHRNRQSNTNSNNNNNGRHSNMQSNIHQGNHQSNHHHNGSHGNYNRYENGDRENGHQHTPPQRTYSKIEQRENKSRNEETAIQNNTSLLKSIKIEKKKNKGGGVKKEEELLAPFDVPDIDETVMSYSAALLGNSVPDENTTQEGDNKITVAKDDVKKSDSETTAEPEQQSEQQPEQQSEQQQPTTEEDRVVERGRGNRVDRRAEKFVPADSDHPKGHYSAGRGRVKPTKGSEIQLNIFSLVQDKKTKKKKLTKVRETEDSKTSQAANPLDSTAPAIRKGKEREDGKPKKLSKMKKIITKEKSESTESSGKSAAAAASGAALPDYCFQSVTPELDRSLTTFLSQLREYNDKAYRTGSAHKRRYCCGLREARKYLKVRKVKCVIIPPNIDKIVSKGGLYDCVHDIVNLSSEQNVPIFYGLNKTRISKILARPKSTITSAVSVLSYDGAEALWAEVVHNAAIAREKFLSESAVGGESQEEEGGRGDHSSDEGEEFEDDNNVLDEEDEDLDEDNESVGSSFVDSGIENNNEISCLSIENGHSSGEG